MSYLVYYGWEKWCFIVVNFEWCSDFIIKKESL